MKNSILLFGLLFFNQLTVAQNLILNYNEPAKIWEEALPLGNSRIGAMVYGSPHAEEIQLNEETIWAGGPYKNDNKKALNALPLVRSLIFENKSSEADKLINETFFTKTHGMPYQTAGSLIINFKGHENFKDYSRELDIEKALSTVRYSVNDVNYVRETFTSFSDDVIIIKISSDKNESISFEANYKNQSQHQVYEKNNILIDRKSVV